MHELSLAQGLCTQLHAIAAEHGANKVARVEIEVGALSNVVTDLLRQALDVLRDEVPLIAEAEFVLTDIPLRVRCNDCNAEHQLEQFVFECPSCRSTRLDVLQGDDLILQRVELEVEETTS